MGKVLNFDLILKRNVRSFPFDNEAGNSDDASKIHKLTHIRLDREEICEIDNLEPLNCVTNLYLQGNCIKTIENLECLAPTLRFLTLANNQITKVQGLSMLRKLGFLDMTDNLIESFDVDQLPKGLVFVAFDGNKCAKEEHYKKNLIESLPNLKSIDGDLLFDDMSDDDDDDSDDDLFDDGDINTDSLKRMAADLLDRSVLRLDELVADHKNKIAELDTAMAGAGDLNENAAPLSDELGALESKLREALEGMIKAEADSQKQFKMFEIAERQHPETTTTTTKPPQTSVDKTKTQNNKKKTTTSTNRVKVFASSGTTTSSANKRPTGVIRTKITNSPSLTRRSSSSHRPGPSSDSMVRIPGSRPFSKK